MRAPHDLRAGTAGSRDGHGTGRHFLPRRGFSCSRAVPLEVFLRQGRLEVSTETLADISSITVIDPVSAALKRFAEARSDLNRLAEDMHRVFTRLELATKQAREQNVKA